MVHIFIKEVAQERLQRSKRFLAVVASSAPKLRLRSATRPFAQLNLLLAHLQHSKFNIVYIPRWPFRA